MSKHLSRTMLLFAAAAVTSLAIAAGTMMDAVVHKPQAQVRSAPALDAPVVATLRRNAPVKIAAQQGLWYQLAEPSGFLRVNDVRMNYGGRENSSSSVREVFGGQAGRGRVSESASVRGLDESNLKSAGYDATQMAKYEAYRASPEQGASAAQIAGRQATQVPYPEEMREARGSQGAARQEDKRRGASMLGGLLGGILGQSGSTAAEGLEVSAGKNEEELLEEELQVGPMIAGRVLGAVPLLDDPQAQQRVNAVGRWIASQTGRPELPWTFGVIDSPEINAFAAPGGYVLLTRGLYELLADDQELAAAIAHELSHVVQRDHYNVLHKQEKRGFLMDVLGSSVSGGGVAGSLAVGVVSATGASVMLTALDRDAEYRSDRAAEIYLARAGYNPMALYAVLQKLAALGTRSSAMAQLFKTHPSIEDRLTQIDRRQYAGLQPYLQR